MQIQQLSSKEETVIRIPLFVVYAIVAFNITAFAVLLQMDMLIFDSNFEKALAWIVAVGVWQLSYLNRNRFYAFRI